MNILVNIIIRVYIHNDEIYLKILSSYSLIHASTGLFFSGTKFNENYLKIFIRRFSGSLIMNSHSKLQRLK